MRCSYARTAAKASSGDECAHGNLLLRVTAAQLANARGAATVAVDEVVVDTTNEARNENEVSAAPSGGSPGGTAVEPSKRDTPV